MAGVKKKALAKISWGGKYKGSLWVLVDPTGKEAKPGSPIDPLARLNKDGLDAARVLANLDDQGVTCQEKIRVIHSEKKRLAGKCAMVHKALQDAKLLQNDYLQRYTEAMRGVEAARGDIAKATDDMNAQLLVLKNAQDMYEQYKLSELAKKLKTEIKTLEREKAAAVANIKKVIAYAKLIKDKNLTGMADAAINKIATSFVAVDYEPKIKALKKEVAALGKRTSELDKEIAKGVVAAAGAKLTAELTGLKNKQKALNDAMKKASEMRKLAMDALDESKNSTPAMRGLADIMEARDAYIKYVERAKEAITNYKLMLKRMQRDLNALAGIYGSVKKFLGNAEKKDKSFSPGSDYGKAIIELARQNGSILVNWQNHATTELTYCKNMEDFLNDDKSKKGPYFEINEIRAKVANTRGDRQKTFRKHKIKCPA
jgi:predicted  nucleic acid-binding Zn-ribbon protein